jgi:hypothetical protein
MDTSKKQVSEAVLLALPAMSNASKKALSQIIDDSMSATTANPFDQSVCYSEISEACSELADVIAGKISQIDGDFNKARDSIADSLLELSVNNFSKK